MLNNRHSGVSLGSRFKREDGKNMRVPSLNHHRYAPAGTCIFCGATRDLTDLTDEHIVPFGLGGNLVLPQASCRDCAVLTSRIERKILRGPLRPIRMFRRMQSRRKHRDAATTLPLRVMFDDQWDTIQVPLEEYPLMLHFHVFTAPGFGDPTYERGIRLKERVGFNFGPTPDEVRRRLGAKEIQILEDHDPYTFARMTAKVAYTYAVAEGALDPRRGRPAVVRSMLKDTNDIGRWVGTSSEPEQKLPQTNHFVWLGRDDARGLLVARIQYLSDSGTPMYLVVLGELSDHCVVTTA